MKNQTTQKILFEKKLGRLSFLKMLLRLPLSLQLLKLSKKHISENRKQLVIFSFDHISSTINLDGIYEKDYLDTFFEWLDRCNINTKTSVAIDIGANIGNHSLYFSDHFKEVYSFEPNPRTYKVLCLNAELVSNIKCYNFGLSDSVRGATLSVNPTNMGGSFITESPATNSQTIELRTLDSFSDIQEVKLIKIDVEGHESAAISGAKNLIKKNKPIILFEQRIEDFKNGKSPVLTLLNELGYKRFATLKKYPYVNGFVKKMFTYPLLKTVLGESIGIKMATEVKPGFHTFIVAIPDWFLSFSDLH